MQKKKKQAVIFIGAPASGKSTFYKEKFFNTHVRVSQDLLKTKSKVDSFVNLCKVVNQDFVLDNTNFSKKVRSKYIQLAKESGYEIIGYYFQSILSQCILRNKGRDIEIPEKGVISIFTKLELPTYGEGFDKLYYVSIKYGNEFYINDWEDSFE